ncbi:hypothetical protein D7J27_21400 [Salmonella enterica]|nr:hypothetical protein [Salmonella enterica]
MGKKKLHACSFTRLMFKLMLLFVRIFPMNGIYFQIWILTCINHLKYMVSLSCNGVNLILSIFCLYLVTI